MMCEDATLEVDGKVYALASATIEQTMGTRTTRRGEVWKVREGLPWAAVTTHDMTARLLHDKGPMRCRVNFGGAVYEGMAWVIAWSDSDSEVIMRVEELEPVAFLAVPTLDETTNPADVEWGEVRSAVAAKDWRRAWEVVGTDHMGEATPGEAYIFGNARRLACVSAALMAWRHVEMPPGFGASVWRRLTGPEGRFGNAYASRWARIKVIAAWESSAAAQYVEPKAKRARAWRDALERNMISIPRTIDGPFGRTADAFIVDDPQPVTGLFRNPFIPANLARVMTHGGGETYTMTVNGERQTYTVPASDVSDMVDALCAGYAAIRGEPTSRIASGNAAISPNPAPHGPARRRR